MQKGTRHIKNLRQLYTFVTLIALIATGKAYSNDEVNIIYDYAPFSENLANKQGSGTASITAIMALDKISTPLKFAYVPIARHENSLSQEDKSVCALFKLKTSARKQDYLFSKPIAFQSSHRLYTQAELPATILNNEGAISSLSELMNAYSNANLILTRDVSYGDVVDAQLAEINPSQINRVSGVLSHNINARMFAHGRSEFSIFTPGEMFRYIQSNRAFAYHSYRIAGMPDVITAHVMCNNTLNSKRLLDEIDANMTKLYSTVPFLSAHIDFQPPEENAIIKSAIELELARN
jgi:uncharacterized protein (TIGR02285 family)